MTATAAMRGAVVTAPGAASVEQAPIPIPGTGEVRVRLEGSGVCGSSLPLWRGQPWFRYPLDLGAPGHEGWGVIDAVGEHVTEVAAGDRVAFLSSHAFAEFDVAPAAAVVRLPESLSDCPVPGEALGCAVNVVRRCRIVPGETVAIVGIGFLGALVAKLAARAGAEVVAISRREFALEVARDQGAGTVVRIADDAAATAQQVAERVGADVCDCVIEAAGTQQALDVASALVKTGGRLVIAGYHQDGPRQIDMQSWNWRGLDVINAHERDPHTYVDGMRAAVESIARGDWNPEPLYTHSFRLDQLQQALDLLAKRPPGFLKALVLA